jgi:hypothetical protein
MIFDVANNTFLEENILHSGCSPDTEPQYLHASPPCVKQMTICVGEKIALDLIILSFFILGSITQ